MKISFLIFLLLFGPGVFAGTYYVSTSGIRENGDGSPDKPWATLSEANRKVPDDGSIVLVMDGTYDGRIRLDRRFTNHAVFKSLNPYKAILINTSSTEQIITSFGGANFTFEGFEIKRPDRSAKGPLLMQVQQSTKPAEKIVIRNNIFHDSYNDDLLKVNNGCDHILIERNVFYNQFGADEHIDVNGVAFVTIQDNIFFNDFKRSGRRNRNNTNAFIVIKNSAHLRENHDIAVRRNIFLNWEGSPDKSFIMVGEDGKSFYEATDVLIENNLLLGNSGNRMKAAFGVMGGKNVTFRSNTVVGDLPSFAYAMRLGRWKENPKNRNVRFYNNIWSDPTGTMGNFSDGDDSDSKDEKLSNNLYYNGGQPFIADKHVLNVKDDAAARIGNPALGRQEDVVLPRWDPAASAFLSGSKTIQEEFERLVALYGIPGPGSIAFHAADPQNAPADDILGRPRGLLPDIGAYDAAAVRLIFLNPAVFACFL